ncbi:MAG: methionine adenosyltransferase [Acidimicrobiia bacterium]
MTWLFTSESVTEGHPDKVADRISDTLLDEILGHDPDARVACETLVTTDRVVLAGEVKTAWDGLDESATEGLVREAVRQIGYTIPGVAFHADTLVVEDHLHEQSGDIRQGVDRGAWRSDPDLLGAGDQGIMFGYATNETDELMPLPILAAHRLAEELTRLRNDGTVAWLRPDGKTQVTVRYDGDRPVAIETVLVSTMHGPDVDQDHIADEIRARMGALLADRFPDVDVAGARWLVNPTGRFVIGGPHGDAGLTGRKIIIDTYGGGARHGGGAFSGKDPSKVDRSAAYAARWVAKHVVDAGLAERAELQVAYAIGVARPQSVHVETFGTHTVDPDRIRSAIEEVFDLRPGAILADLDLTRPIYTPTSAYGHFGRPGFTWEETPRVDALAAAAGA